MEGQGVWGVAVGVVEEELVGRSVVCMVMAGDGVGAHFGAWGRIVRLWEMGGLLWVEGHGV